MCVSDEKRATIYETLGLINEQLWLGHFELWSNSGLVLFRNGALLGSGETLSLEQAQTLIETALDECERFIPCSNSFCGAAKPRRRRFPDRKSTRLNSSH